MPFFEDLAQGWRYRTDIVDWPVHYTRAIENQLDVAHLAFVHRTTIGRGKRSLVDGPYAESDQDGMRLWVSNARDHGQTRRSHTALREATAGQPPRIRFLFPGTWLLQISPSIRNFVAFVPVNEHTTRYYLRFYHRLRLPWIAPLFETAMGWVNRLVLEQDRGVVVTQTPANGLAALSDTYIEADRAIIEFRKRLASMLSR